MGALFSQVSPDANSPTAIKIEPDNESLKKMVTSSVVVVAFSLILSIAFLYFRRTQPRHFAPRTHLGSLRHNERSIDLGTSWLGWLGTFSKLPDTYALTRQGLDAYLFLRFLRVATIIGLVGICITWPILFPINATGMGTAEQLEILSYSNVDTDKSLNRFYAHCFVGCALYSFVMYMILCECIFYINLRQAYLLAPHQARRISSRTVLFTLVAPDFLDETQLRRIFNQSIRHIWLTGKTDKLDKLVKERDKVAMKLERAEVELIKKVHKASSKTFSGERDDANGRHEHDAETGNLASRYVSARKRPSHRLGPLGLVGEKVDTIEWCRSELERLIPEITTAQNGWSHGQFDKTGALFIEFHTQADAEAAYQTVTHHEALRMCFKVTYVKPSDVIWKNLSIPWWQLIIRRFLVLGLFVALVIIWAVPIAIIGIMEEVKPLKVLPGLTWINDIPGGLSGFVFGTLPPLLMIIVMSPAHGVMHMCAKLAGVPTMARAELFTQNAYFAFEFIQVLLVQTVSSTAVAALSRIASDPSVIVSTLAGTLSTAASDFYISFFILEGLGFAVNRLTRVLSLLVSKLRSKFHTGTPRAMYEEWTALSAMKCGSLLPIYTNMVCISLVFSVIAPLVLGWSTIALAMFYFAFRYNMFFVSETAVDTQGLIYPQALKQLFVGIYAAEVAMVGLFSSFKAAGPAALMAVFLVLTILFHVTIFGHIDPLLYGLPRSLFTEEQTTEASTVETVADAGSHGVHGRPSIINKAQSRGSGVKKKGNFIVKFLKPWIYADLATLRAIVPVEEDVSSQQQYTNEVEATAYLPPSVTAKTRTLWIPADSAGVSKQEVALTGKFVPITDDGATMDDKNKINWDRDGARPPIWKEKIYY